MSAINLLPWRQQVAARQKREFALLMAACLLLTSGAVLAGNVLVNELIARQQARNQRLQQEIQTLDGQLAEIARIREAKTALLARMNLIDELQRRRNLPVRIFSELPHLVPNGVYLGQLQLQGARTDITGKTEAYGRVADMLRQIDGTGWLGQSRISTIFASDRAPVALSQFSVQFQILGQSQIGGHREPAAAQ